MRWLKAVVQEHCRYDKRRGELSSDCRRDYPLILPIDPCYVTRYTVVAMICNIRHKGLAALYFEDQTRGVQQAHVRRLRQILALLDSATTLEDINAPGLRLHALKGDLAGYYSVTVSGNWRVIFRLAQGDVLNVDYLDYH